MCKNKINVNNFENYYNDFSYGFIKMSKPGGKISASKKSHRPKGHQSSIRKGGAR